MPFHDEDDRLDPFASLRSSPANDPFAALRSTPGGEFDTFAALRSGGDDLTKLPADRRLALLEAQLQARKGPRNWFLEGVSNIPHHAGEIVHGLSKLAGLATRGLTNPYRILWNEAVGDDKEAEEVRQEYANALRAVPEIAKAEWDRIKESYGSVEGFQESFRERPLDLIFDVAALADIAAAPVRLAASRAGTRAAAAAVAATPETVVASRGPRLSELRRRGLPEALASETRLTDISDPRRLPKLLGIGEEVAPPIGLEDRVVNLLKGAEDEALDAVEGMTGAMDNPAKRAAFLATATDKTLQHATVQQRLASAKRLEKILTDEGIPDLFQSATVLDKTAETIRLGNAFRLGYHTIGVIPGGRQFLERFAGAREASKFTALIDRGTEQIANDFVRTGKVQLKYYHALPDNSKERVLHSVQSLVDDVSLTAEESLARQEMVNLGKFAQGKLGRVLAAAKHPDPEGLLSRRVMANAITGEALFRAAKRELNPMESRVYGSLQNLRHADHLVKNVGKFEERAIKLAEERGKLLDELADVTREQPDLPLPGDFKVRTKRHPEVIMEKIDAINAKLDETNFKVGLVKTAERRYKEGTIGFIPGQRRFPEVSFLDSPGTPPGFLGNVEKKITEMSAGRFKHLNRKRNIVDNPLVVEELYLKYMDSLARYHGQLKIQDNLKAISTRINEHDYVTMMKRMEVKGENIHGYNLVKLSDGTMLNVPEGMKRVYEAALKRTPVDRSTRPFLRALDFTRGEFTKNVLAMNPGWLVYNILGGGMLYTLAGGSPRALAKAIQYQTASILEGTEWIGKHPRLGKMVSKLAEEYREMVPVSQVSGFTSTQAREFRHIEHISPDQQHFADTASIKLPYEVARSIGKGDAKRAAEAYAQLTQNIADLPHKVGMPSITEMNEIVEEVWRAATWMSSGQQQVFARQFAATGQIMWSLNSPEMRASFAKMAYELDPKRILERGGLKLSPETKATMDLTNKFMNDYYRIGPVERKIMRRIIPFYSWMKFTNKLAVQLPFDHPIRMSIAAHTSNAINDAKANDHENLPDWMKDMVKVKDNPDGTTTFQSGRGANPFIGILLGEEGMKEAIGGLNPVLMVPIQWSVGFDTFRQGPYRVAPERAARQGVVRDFGGKKGFKLTGRGIEETTPRPSVPLALTRGGLVPFPFFRQFEKIVRGGPHDDIGSMSELAFELGRIATGGPRVMPGAFLDDKTGKPFDSGSVGTTLLKGAGISTLEMDTKALVEREVEDKLSAVKKIAKELEEERINALRKNLP